MQPKRWIVATWKYRQPRGALVGSSGSLVLHMNEETVTFATGPTPWGTGSWGPFPVSVVESTRELRADDSWSVSGCPEERWTAADLLRAIKRARGGPHGPRYPASEIETSLEAAIAKAAKAA